MGTARLQEILDKMVLPEVYYEKTSRICQRENRISMLNWKGLVNQGLAA